MREYLKNRFSAFIKNKFEWISCVANVVLCLCMAYFYYDSDQYAPLFYSIFFFAYVFLVFLVGERVIPIMYIIYIFGATQNVNFINCTGFFIIIFLAILYKKQRLLLFTAYAVDVFIVCFRHDKNALHLLCHFAFCVVFYLFAVLVRSKIEEENIEKWKDKIKAEVENEIKEDYRQALLHQVDKSEDVEIIKDKVKNLLEIKQSINYKRLILDDTDYKILNELSHGAKQKEIEGYAENTVSKRLKKMRERNEIETNSELILHFLEMEKLTI